MWLEGGKTPGEYKLMDLDCSGVISGAARIQEPVTFSATGDGAPLVFGAFSINNEPITYQDLRTVAPGQVIQVLIGGGSCPAGGETRYTILASFRTNFGEIRQGVFTLVVRV